MYKIVRPREWAEWQHSGPGGWAGSADDLRDGFVHLSTAAQVEGTVARYFAAEPLIYVVRVDPAGLPLRWEPARDGALFPHVYGPLPIGAAREVREIRSAD